MIHASEYCFDTAACCCAGCAGPYQPGSWGSRAPDGGTARSPHILCAGGGWGSGTLFWTTEMPEVPLRHTPAHRGRLAAAPEPSEGQTETEGGGSACSRTRNRTARRVYIHRKPCVSNLWLNLNHLIWTSAVGKQLRELSSYLEVEAKQLHVCWKQEFTGQQAGNFHYWTVCFRCRRCLKAVASASAPQK